MPHYTYSSYIKTRGLMDLKSIYFLYTLTIPTHGDKSYFMKHISKFIIPDNTYKDYMSQYDLLSYTEKKILGEYQTTFYVPINNYMITKKIDINLAVNDTTNKKFFSRLVVSRLYNDLLVDEYNRLYNTKSSRFIASDNFKYRLTKTLSDIYIDGLGLYEYNVSMLNTQIKTLYSITTKHTVANDCIMFRGEDYEDQDHMITSLIASTQTRPKSRLSKIQKYKKNDIIENKGFVSCSLDPLTAILFSGMSTCCLYRYFIKKGTPGFIIPPYGNEHTGKIEMEFECLFAPHTFKIIQVHKIPSGLFTGIVEKDRIYTIFDVQIINISPFPKLL